MKRILIISLLLGLLSVLAAVSFCYWAVSTTNGSLWLLKIIDNIEGVSVSTKNLTGTLTDELQIENLHINWQDGQVVVGDLQFKVVSYGLLPPQVKIDFLKINHLTLRLREEADVPTQGASGDFTEMNLVGIDLLPRWLDADIKNLDIVDFVYETLDDPEDQVVIANLIAGHYHLANERLHGERFAYHSPYIHLDGDFTWELSRPHLVMDAQVYLPDTCVDQDLFKSLRVPIDFPGHIELDGDWNHYTGPVQFGSKGINNNIWLSANVTGSWRGIRFEDLQGDYLEGQVSGNLDLSWIDSYRMHGMLYGSALNPAKIVEELEGRTSFDLSGELFVPYNSVPFTSRLNATIHDTLLFKNPIEGHVAGTWSGTNLRELDLDFHSNTSYLMATGQLDQRVDLDIDIAELQPFYPDFKGALTIQGWVSWAENVLTGDLVGTGEDLTWKEWTVETAQFKGRHVAADKAVSLEFIGYGLHFGKWSLEQGECHLNGDRRDHRLELSATGNIGHAEAELIGHLNQDIWTGTLETMMARDMPWGNWSLTRPASLSWQADDFTVVDLSLAGSSGARIDISKVSLKSGDIHEISLNWQDVALDGVSEELDNLQFATVSSGSFHYESKDSLPHVVTGKVFAHGRVQDDLYEFVYENIFLELSWDQSGLLFSGTLESTEDEVLATRLTSLQAPSWTWPLSDMVADIEWHGVNVARLNRLLDVDSFQGHADGDAHFEMVDTVLARMSLHTSIDGRLFLEGRELGPRTCLIDLHWDEERFQVAGQIESIQGGTASLRLTSETDPEFSWPESGTVDMQIDSLNLALFEPWLPEDVNFEGTFDGNAYGRWVDQDQFSLTGSMLFSESEFSWSSEEGQVRLPVKSASLEWQWEGESLSGVWSLVLAKNGQMNGSWQLPIAAHFPIQIDEQQLLQARMEGKLQASGVLKSIGPWLIQETRGNLAALITVNGTWRNPVLGGSVTLSDGVVYLPESGIQLEDITLRAILENKRVRLEELSLRSGPGKLTGAGEINFDGWRPKHYTLTLNGEKLQIFNFPEFYMLCDPDLVLSGTPERFSMKGSVHLPVLRIRSGRTTPPVLPSDDVEVVVSIKQEKELTIETDVRVVVSLGEDVTVKTAGVDTRLQGEGTVTMDKTGALLVWGEIRLVSGSYRAYGTRLDIRQGVLKYRGVPVTKPDLRIFAAREIGSVLAGVQISGTAEAPVVSLYSQPAMPERDILGYILMGRSISSDSQDNDMLMMGAGALLSSSDGGGLSKLGFTDIDIQGLYIGVGGIRLRRRLTGNWELESTLGIDSAVDLYYVLEFD